MTAVTDALRRLLAQLEEEESTERLEGRLQALEDRAQAGKPITMESLLEVIRGASDEELEALEGTLVGRFAREEEERREREAKEKERKPKPKPKPSEGEEGGEGEGEGEPKTRPGRKQGRAYDWETDAEGRVLPLEVARVWTGDDEPDLVEVPDETPAGEEGTA